MKTLITLFGSRILKKISLPDVLEHPKARHDGITTKKTIK